MSRAALTTAVLSSILVLSAVAEGALSSPTDTHVGFHVNGTAGMSFDGTTTELDVADQNGSVTVTVALGKLATGIDLRDHHMREKYLEVQKYPTAVLTLSRAALRIPANGERASADVPGTLLLHGQSRPVMVHYDATGDAAGSLVSGRLHVNMNDYGISVPSYLGVTVKPDVDVTASFRVAGN
jgi:polyisoprenoid-binding protein YceI